MVVISPAAFAKLSDVRDRARILTYNITYLKTEDEIELLVIYNT